MEVNKHCCWTIFTGLVYKKLVVHEVVKSSSLDSVLLQFVIVSLTGWGVLIFSGYKFFTGGKGKKEEVLKVLLNPEYYVLLFIFYNWA